MTLLMKPTSRNARGIICGTGQQARFDPVDLIDDYGYHKGHLIDPIYE
jgi:hypothetical protein